MPDIETISPLDWPEVDCLCRIGNLMATCSRCGFATRKAHMGVAFHGWFCPGCCPACDGSLTLTMEEFRAMEKNWLAGADERERAGVERERRQRRLERLELLRANEKDVTRTHRRRSLDSGRKRGQILDYSLALPAMKYGWE